MAHRISSARPRRPLLLVFCVSLASVVAISGAIIAGVALQQRPSAHAAPTSYLGLVNLGMPTAPQPFMPSNFAITEHLRNAPDYGPPVTGGTSMTADHGPGCEAPPTTHQADGSYASMVWVCHDHVMTSISSANNGYGEISLQPNQLVDFSDGATATVDISVSTWRMSDRDWLDFNFSSFNQQLAYPVDSSLPDGQGLAENDVQVSMCSSNGDAWCAYQYVNGQETQLQGDSFTQLQQIPGFSVSKSVRTQLEFQISATHFKFWAPTLHYVFYDVALPHPLSFDQAIFQFTHHSYTTTKDPNDWAPAEQQAAGLGNMAGTWHWSNLAIDRAVPYFLSMGMPEAAGDGIGSAVDFAQPAPAGAMLRFVDHGPHTQVSFDGGTTWQTPAVQQHTTDKGAANIWQPVPAGTRHILLRGGSGWYARDFYLMAPPSSGGTSPPAPGTATATPMPAMPSPTPTGAIPPPVTINNQPCTVVLSGVSQSGNCSGTFTPSK
jgi:hypothetical protein